MVSHLILNLRSFSTTELPTSSNRYTSTKTGVAMLTTRADDVLIGNLGNDVWFSPDGFDDPDAVDLWYTCKRLPPPSPAPPILKQLEVEVEATVEVVSSPRMVHFPDPDEDEDASEQVLSRISNVTDDERSNDVRLREERPSGLRASWQAPFDWSWRGDGR